MNRSKNAALAAFLILSLAGAALGARKDPCVGKILKSGGDKALLETGDKVTIVFKKNRSLPAGTRLTAYKITPDLMNTRADADKEKRIEVEVGTVEIVRLNGVWRAVGRVVGVTGDLEPGTLLRPETVPAREAR